MSCRFYSFIKSIIPFISIVYVFILVGILIALLFVTITCQCEYHFLTHEPRNMIMFKSEIAVNAHASAETNRLVLNSLGLDDHEGQVQYMVIKSEFSGEEIYCALAGGEIVDNDVNLTPVGTGAYEALCSLPGDEIAMYALSDDDSIMEQQIPGIMQQHKSGSRICFISDSLVERQTQIMRAFAMDDASQQAA